MVIAARQCGLIGSFPAPNARTIQVLDEWLKQITEAVQREPDCPGNWSLNLVVHHTYSRLREELELVQKYKPPIVITALGSPRHVVDLVQGYGGIVIADVSSIKYAKKAACIGVDGLALVSAGAGGHTGTLSPFTFIPAVRDFFDGIIVYAGGIGTGEGIAAAEVLGADLVYMGTRFIATDESRAVDQYKNMLVAAGPDDFVLTDSFTGAEAYYLRESILKAGYDLDDLKPKSGMDFGGSEDTVSAWKDIWSAGPIGQLVSSQDSIESVTRRLVTEYHQSKTRAN